MSGTPGLSTDLYHHRQQFPALENKAYFNYGGQGPMAQGTLDAIAEAEMHMQRIGPFGVGVRDWVEQQKTATRSALASELNVPAETITLTEDVTVGCNIAMWGLDWHSGDHILLSDCEHPGVVAIATEIGQRFSVEISFCSLVETLNVGDATTVVAQHLRPTTRLVILSHVFWNTGQVLPLDKIISLCKQNNTKLLVDAAQSVGLLPLNLTELGADFYAFTGHKWLCGPAGVGGLYVKPEVREQLRPTFIGWRSVACNSQGQPVDWYPDGRRYEVATSSYSLYAGLAQAISIQQQWGTPEERYEKICRNSEYLNQRLAAIPQIKCLKTSPLESGLVSFQLTEHQPHSSRKLVEFLESQGLFTRTILYPDCIRACVHYFTLESEIDQLVAAIQGFCQM